MEQLLQITTIPISYELKISDARLERESSSVGLKVSRNRGGLKIQNRPAKLRLDTYDARNSLAPTIKTSITQAAERGYTQALEAAARYAKEGQMYLESQPGQGSQTIGRMIAERSAFPTGEFQMAFLPKGGVNISASQPYFSVQYQMDKLNFDWRINEGSVNFVPGDIEMSITQYPDVRIEYVGDPMYVPPSAGARFTGEYEDVQAE